MNAKTIQLLTSVLLALVVGAPSVAQAADNAEDRGPIVRRKVLYRSTRFEITPQVGTTLNDAFRRNFIGGLGLQYHLTNEFGIAVTGGFAALHGNTDLANNIEATLSGRNADRARNVSFAQMNWLVDLSLTYVPIFGKFNVFQRFTMPYDLHLNGGLVILAEKAVPLVEGGTVDEEIEGIRPGGVIGGGVRMFLSDMLSLNVDLKTMLVSRASVSSGSASAELKPAMLATVGIGIFLPGTVKISR